jgi:hypothetical protein
VRSISFKFLPSSEELKQFGISTDYLFSSLSIDLGGGLKIFYQGLSTNIPVKVGQKVKKGDIIGYSSYMRGIFDEPTIHISMSKNTHATDIGKYLFGKGYVSKDYLIKEIPAYIPTKTYSPAQLKEDFKLFRSALEEGHPGLYTYTKKTEFDQLFDAALQKLDKPMTEEEFIRILLPLIAKIGCGHTQLIHSFSFNKFNRPLIPIVVCFIQDRCFLRRDLSGKNLLQPGTEILSINKIPIKAIRENLLRYMSSDGYNTSYKDFWIQRIFMYLYYDVFGSAARFDLEIALPDGKTKTVVLDAVFMQDIIKNIQSLTKRNEKSFKDPVELKILTPDKAYLRVSDFSLFDQDQISGFFKELNEKKINFLILDLRGNLGGSDENLNFLYSFFTEQSFNLIQYKKVNIQGNYRFFKNTENYFAGFPMNNEFKKISDRDGFYFFPEKTKPQEKNRYNGKLFVLINGGTFSAASTFCALLYKQKGAVFIGEETGGGYYQLNAEKFGYLKLTHVPVLISIPLVKIVQSEEIDPRIPIGHGIIPDYPYQKILDDYINPEKDNVFHYAIKLIDAKK